MDKDKAESENTGLKALTVEEKSKKRLLERTIEETKSTFVAAGLALKELRDLQLYRETHTRFESYCRHRFRFSKTNAYYKIAAAEIYEIIRVSTFTNCELPNDVISLPTKEGQLRPMIEAKLEPDEQIEVWTQALNTANGKTPSGTVVKSIIDQLRERKPVPNPWRVGEIARIVVKGNPDLRGRGDQWCIVEEIYNFSVTVRFWDGVFPIPLKIEHLTEWVLSPEQREEIRKLCDRLNGLYSDELDPSILAFLAALGKLSHPWLSHKEEKVLRVLEEDKG